MRAGGPELLEGLERSSSPSGFPRVQTAKPGKLAWKARASWPACLLAFGVALLAIGAGLVAAPLALRAASGGGSGALAPAPPQGGASGLDAEGVPLGAAEAAARQAEGELVDCAVTLPDRAAYEAGAAAAELALLGTAAASLPPDQLQAALGGLPPLLFGTVFWVLVSESHPWQEAEITTAAAAQVGSLNAAFSGLNISFRLDAVLPAPAASDATVEGCTARWEALAARVLGSGGGADPESIHVVVCEPEGVRGAAAVLGGGQPGGATAEGAGVARSGAILLRRSALWLSHSSMVHQVGHFLGVAHPFPDDRQTCKVDGDAIADTPLQYAPNHDCQPSTDDDLHVCQTSGDGPLPNINFMDLTNDTCRWHFTPGQAARMQAMLRAYRPRLFAAGLQWPQPQASLAFQRAWQSAPPPAGVQAQQVAAYLAQQQAAGSNSSSDQTSGAAGGGGAANATALAAVLQRFWGPWSQARSAADGQLSSTVQDCACLGPDAAGATFWTGQLNASYAVDAVRLLLPMQPEAGAGSEAEDQGVGGAATADPPPVQVEVYVGDSLDHAQNQRCVADGAGPARDLPLQQPLHTLACQPAVAGRHVTIALAAGSLPQPRQQLCLCEVQPLTLLAPAVPANGPAAGSGGGWRAVPAVPLNITADNNMAATQNSGTGSGSGGASPAHMALAGALRPGFGLPAEPPCSSSAAAGQPWWSLDAGLDGAWVRALRLAVPLTCQPGSGGGGTAATGQPAAEDCVPAAAKLDVYVGDVPPVQLVAAGAGAGRTSGDESASLCAAGVPVPGGRPVEIDCGRLMHGQYITVVSAPLPAPAPLALCGVELLGAHELLAGEHMVLPAYSQPAPLAVEPPELQPLATLAIDGDEASCVDAPGSSAGTASWSLQLDGSYNVLAVRLTAQAAASGKGRGSRLAVSLLNAGGALAAAWQPASSANASSGGASSTVWELPVATPAAVVRVEGFASLCELQLLAAQQQPVKSYQLQSSLQWQILGAQPSATGEAAGSGTNGSSSALLDDDPRTCLTAAGSANGSAAGFELLLGRPYRIDAVRLVGGGSARLAASVVAPHGQCRPLVALRPWQPAFGPCAHGSLVTDRLMVGPAAARGQGDVAAQAAAGGADPPFVLCGVALFGAPQPPDL